VFLGVYKNVFPEQNPQKTTKCWFFWLKGGWVKQKPKNFEMVGNCSPPPTEFVLGFYRGLRHTHPAKKSPPRGGKSFWVFCHTKTKSKKPPPGGETKTRGKTQGFLVWSHTPTRVFLGWSKKFDKNKKKKTRGINGVIEIVTEQPEEKKRKLVFW